MIEIYTDGSNVHNGKPYSYGGYGFVIKLPSGDIFEHGGKLEVNEKDPVTNNKAELMAIIKALEFVMEGKLEADHIRIFSDSQWCVNCINKQWARKKNKDLWVQFGKKHASCIRHGHIIQVTWVKGHVGIELNEQADRVAGEYCKMAKPVA